MVGSICDHGDDGTPIALGDTVASQAFIHVAREVIDAVDRRNEELPPTQKVNVTKK